MNCSTPGLPVHHQLPESTQTHVHQVGNVIQPSHPLLSPSPLYLNLSQHQGLFKWVSSLHQVAKVLEFELQLNFDNSIIITIHLQRREIIYCGSDGKEFAYNVGDPVQSLGWKDLLEKEMATHSSILAWKIPWTEEPGGLQSMGSQRVGHDFMTSLSLSLFT